MEYKTCTKCKAELPATEEYFYKQLVRCKTKPDYYTFSPWCKECQKQSSLDHLHKNKEEIYERQRPYKRATSAIRNKRAKEWRKNNPEKNHKNQVNYYYNKDNEDRFKKYAEDRKKKNHKISTMEWKHCKEYFNHTCAYCGLSLNEHWITYRGVRKLGDFHREHLNHEGENDLSNCVPSCFLCNIQKWKFDFNVWYNETNPKYSEERYNKIIKWLTEDYKLYIR